MNEHSTVTTFEPVTGLIVFKDPRNGNHYLQVHNIEKKDKTFVWNEGKPFQREELQELALSLKKEQISSLKVKGLLPENVLYYQPGISGNKFIWFVGPEQYHMTFTPKLKIRQGKFIMPGLIFAVVGKELFIYAYKGKLKPTAKTELFNAPFYNVYEDGEVCMGTISESRKKQFLHEEIDRWERRFFGGRFTDAHGEDEKLAKGFKLKTLYNQLRTSKTFPEKALAKCNEYKTLEAFVKSVAERGKDE